MNKFIDKITVAKKLSVIMIVGTALALGLRVWSLNQDFIQNFRPYYAQSYWGVITEKFFPKNTNNPAAVIQGLGNSGSGAADRLPELAKSVPVIVYHGILDNTDGLNISQKNFMDQMYALKRAGWQTITLAEFLDFMKGKRTFPDRSFLLTFDDGRKDSYYPVDPILRDLNYTAVMYVITNRSLTGAAKTPFHLSLSELEIMHKNGRWELQSHGKNDHDLYQIDPSGKKGHFLSNKLWLQNENRPETDNEYQDRILEDMMISKNELESAFGRQVRTFAFPFTDFGQNQTNFSRAKADITTAIQKVYDIGFYSVWPSRGDSFNYPIIDLPLTKRIDVLSDWTGADLLSTLEVGRTKAIPYLQSSNFGNEWMVTWGNVRTGDTLKLSADDGTTGAAVFLNGSYLFKDYSFFANTGITTDTRLSLVALRRDNDNYISCTFSKNEAAIENWSNGNEETIADQTGLFELPVSSVWLGISVDGSTVNCFAGNKLVASTNIDPVIKTGSIGIKVWRPDIGKTAADVKEIRVDSNNNLAGLIKALPDYSIKMLSVNRTSVSGISNENAGAVKDVEVIPIQSVPTAIILTDNSGNPLNYQITNFTQTAPWIPHYGALVISDGSLKTGSRPQDDSSFMTLAGSENWTDYQFNIVADWHIGRSLSLIARYQDGKNYAACAYSLYGSHVRAYYVLGGQVIELGESPQLPIPYTEPWRDRLSAVRVVGDQLTCLMNGEEILHYSLPPSLLGGGIGIKTWDPAVGTDFAIKSVTVEPRTN